MVRLTLQKKQLYTSMKQFRSFFDASQLHEKVVRQNPKIGIATVYRFLKRLEETGEIHSYSCHGKKIYSLSKKNHCHLHCERCGSVTHLELEDASFLKKLVVGEICHFQLDVTGVCKKCSKNDERQ